MKAEPHPYDHFPVGQRGTADAALAASKWARHLPPSRLTHRIATAGDGSPTRGFYTLGPDMPR